MQIALFSLITSATLLSSMMETSHSCSFTVSGILVELHANTTFIEPETVVSSSL
uniref:Uncharacterized protein n=1 Tax=Arundo donax TaxID=35708 RepID=A0A0A9CQA5_ARUDO